MDLREQYYRGYRWYSLTIGGRPRTYVDVPYPNTAGTRVLYTFNRRVTPESNWKRAHGERKRIRNYYLWTFFEIEPYDRIPWEIHEIEDEAAYQSALRAYLEAAL